MISFEILESGRVRELEVHYAPNIPAAAARLFEYMTGTQLPQNLPELAASLVNFMLAEGATERHSFSFERAEEVIIIENAHYSTDLLIKTDVENSIIRFKYTTGGGRVISVDPSNLRIDFGPAGSENFADLCLRALLGVDVLPELPPGHHAVAVYPNEEKLRVFDHVFPTSSRFRAPLWLRGCSEGIEITDDAPVSLPPYITSVTSVQEAMTWLP